ncbi:nicotinamidase/pyrazinamidase [Hartmannibacter diazotrophicus]|uniref:Nicotinamidase n=1 Tax=Hartmannibacter diazotrophicus TaxID=1482074 RepID=A0A2C9DBM9_9HYPH|nr:bifunctional nicotinamidase/pyrazinamidase [Hartmannibacter diazotrophicus]SON57570.1 nicotinamidase/pyrazinamidase [Hartmannibacter diazotrophicus]
MATDFRADEALVVIDVQKDFCPGGALAVTDGDAVVEIINALSPRFAHVVATQDWHPAGHLSFASSHPGKAPFETIEADYGLQTLWSDHCVKGSDGAAFHPGLDLNPVELIVRKGFRPEIDSYSAFFENDRKTTTGLAGALRERGFRRLYFVGLATDFCVAYSAIDAAREGFEAVVLLDACRGIDLGGSLDAAIAEMKAAGVSVVNGA